MQWRVALRIYPEFVAARYNLACALLDLAAQPQWVSERFRLTRTASRLAVY
jgi:hypothetical protein